MIDRDWDPGSQRKIGDRGDLWLRGRESKSNSSIGDSDFDSLAITLRGNPRAFHRLGRRIAVVRKWLLLGSFIWMQYPEDQSFGLQDAMVTWIEALDELNTPAAAAVNDKA
ncbi:hypothetical protein F2Q69_00018859 [Brassica cretica]|uniref:Uncharacterized protein n=1 Tax=Brassica cretica TaxID=69181 RepID=A0A8S9Q4I7_BRACR|nr:hypothetical protein F2Q69_00018859 [Brassica cretica]